MIVSKDVYYQLVLSFYLGEHCGFCGKEYATTEDIEGAVWYPHEHGNLVCKKCYDIAIGKKKKEHSMDKQVVNEVKVWLYMSNQPIVHRNAQSYQKGDLYCVFEVEKGKVYKYPIQHIFRISEDYPIAQQEHAEEGKEPPKSGISVSGMGTR